MQSFADPEEMRRATDARVLVGERTGDPVAVRFVREGRAPVQSPPERREITWHPNALERAQRWERLGARGATVWLTGLPAAGKSTIAVTLERALVESGQAAYLLDGDNIRHGLNDDLSFGPGDRAENCRRVGHVARLFADAGVVAVVSLVSPLAADRAAARTLHEAAGLPFVEVYVDTDVEECARRDPKGLYGRARAGLLPGFTGVDAPYEPPEAPTVHIRTAELDVDAAVARILDALGER